ncbi:complement factor H-like [Ptychodera flava]|uniref:complement factor H-like n=1 Tax=Ptychodera flava TaxID=63121 RepID=UPI00396A1817
MVQVLCNKGYSLEGIGTIVCLDGNYVNYQPGVTSRCKESCTRPAFIDIIDIVNGFPDDREYITSGNVITFRCKSGYSIVGRTQATCDNGEFDHIPRCVESCTRPALIDIINIVDGFPDDREYIASGNVIAFECESGYSIDGPKQATCDNGEFDQIPRCVANCDMTALPNARITGSNVHGGVGIVKCKAGFIPSDDYQVVCTNGQWRGPIICEDLLSEYIAVYFPFENDFRDVSGNGRDGVPVQTVSFAENMGVSGTAAWFTGDGRVEVQTEFLANNNFSVSLWFKQTNNVLRKQGLVSLQGYGDVKGSELVLPGTENQVLYAGVATPGEDDWDYVDITAMSNRWHHALYTYDGTEFNLYFDGEKQNRSTFSECCLEILKQGYATLRIGQTGLGQARQYFYGLIDEVYILNMTVNETTALMMYKRDTAKCFEPPDPIPNGRYEADFPVNGVNGTVKVLCNEGYSLAGADTVTCTNRNYVNYQPGVTSKCKESCTRPALHDIEIVDGFPDDREKIASGNVITVRCKSGYSILGSTQATCNNGEFDHIPQCVANCDMTAPPNARIRGSNAHHGVAIVKCKAGFTPSDDYKVNCRFSQWHGPMPVCKDLLSEYIAVYFPFENDFRDASGNGRGGTPEGRVSRAENGVTGNAAWFTGYGQVEVQTEFLTNNNFSVSLWFKQTRIYDRTQGLISLEGYGDVLGSELVLPQFENQVLYAGIASPGGNDWDYADIAATSNHWHHALYTYDGVEFNLYFDGEKPDRFPECCMEIEKKNHAPLRIGQTGFHNYRQYFYGLIDEVYIFNMALNETTAHIMYERDKSHCGDPQLLVQYTFNDGVQDSSCYGWNGVPHGRVSKGREGAAWFEQGRIEIEEFRNFIWGSSVSISFWFQCFNCSEGRSYPAPEKFPRNRKGLITNGKGYDSPGTFELALDDTEEGTFIEVEFVRFERDFLYSKSVFSPRELRAQVTGVQHVVLVHDNSGSRLYLDGHQVANSSNTGELHVAHNSITIGVTYSDDSNHTHYFQGEMDDLRIYSKTLSEEDIKELHLAGPQ